MQEWCIVPVIYHAKTKTTKMIDNGLSLRGSLSYGIAVSLTHSDVDTRWLSGYSHNSTSAGASKNTTINN
jgi:hypothetical protein